MRPTWLDDLGLVETERGSGTYRYKRRKFDICFFNLPPKGYGQVCSMTFPSPYYAALQVIVYRGASGKAFAAWTSGSDKTDPRQFAATLNLAADIAAAFNANQEATDAEA